MLGLLSYVTFPDIGLQMEVYQATVALIVHLNHLLGGRVLRRQLLLPMLEVSDRALVVYINPFSGAS